MIEFKYGNMIKYLEARNKSAYQDSHDSWQRCVMDKEFKQWSTIRKSKFTTPTIVTMDGYQQMETAHIIP